MNRNRNTLRRVAGVLSAAAVLALLAGSLVLRVQARDALQPSAERPQLARPAAAPLVAPAASVPAPATIALAELPTPRCWGCSSARYTPLEFQVDLDVLAPLGDGEGNLALWLRDFAKQDGARFVENYREHLQVQELDGVTWKVLPGDDPLLLEAEPWLDQAHCSFYPEVWELGGLDTPIPNLLHALDLARSFIVRGHLGEDRELAKEDYRRAIRLGRLLRQDDATLIQDLVAIAAIRLGAEALYEQAQREGNAALMTAAALVMADKDAMRARAAQRTTISDRVFQGLQCGLIRGWFLKVDDDAVDQLARHAQRVPERRYVLEAMLALRIVRHHASSAQRDVAVRALESLAERADPLIAERAREALEEPWSDEQLALFLGETAKSS